MSHTPAPFSIGDTVYVAWAESYSTKTVPCPVCLGNLYATLILGDGSQTPVECDFCGKGYEGPRGVVKIHAATSGVRSEVVSGLELTDRGWIIKGDWRSYNQSDGVVFYEKERAGERAAVLFQEAEKQAQANFESQFKGTKKNHTWTVGYHQAEIRELERKMAWHRGKLSARKQEKT